jgi:hypothetical protein
VIAEYTCTSGHASDPAIPAKMLCTILAASTAYVPVVSSSRVHHLPEQPRPRCAIPKLSDAGTKIDRSVDVSDLNLVMADLEKPLETTGDADVQTRGVESTSGVAEDGGVQWTETSTLLSAELAIPGLMGQPAEALAVELTETTMTVTAFAMPIWSAILKGRTEPAASEPRTKCVTGMPPTISVEIVKAPGSPRWNGLIESIGVDSVLQ